VGSAVWRLKHLLARDNSYGAAICEWQMNSLKAGKSSAVGRI
jgi:hypothetical protein